MTGSVARDDSSKPSSDGSRPDLRRSLPRSLVHTGLGVTIAACLLFAPRPFDLLPAAAALVFGSVDLLRLRVPAIGNTFKRAFRLFLRSEERTHITGATY